MGRGRQKAKHTKVARDLKYFSPDTNYTALQQELGGNPRLEEDLEKWADYIVDEVDTDDDELDEPESKTA
ncbi:DUF3073 domain-containing protein [Pseudolysinimonas yzui]|jgi:hypothetical protein|uniref:DUF3073 domain-containing protein n=1 Tax=Pseudolysinimonas yzui TaxID=2708254 RepID=A0A8J3GS47_9MICO|nr:DUF3073 domain-containing protein [Pseudolysinimonas yzui]GHF22323.1 hypothetical protein GCM10011600_24350 [Pseudolysinimonas yzui]